MGAAAAEVLTAGAELAGLLDRLLRREGNVSLAHYRLLSALAARSPDAVEPWELARGLRMSSAHVTNVVAHLHERGLLLREAHPSDGRRRLVRLAPGGAERLAALRPAVESLERRLLGPALTADEQAALGAMLRRLREAMGAMVVPDVRSQVGP